jgi:3'-5' exoribonuclease
MTTEKKVFAGRITDGQAVEDIFLVKVMNLAETRSGKPYLMLTLADRSGEIEARLWENAETFLKACEPGNLVQISGQAQLFREALQVKIDSVLPVDKKDVDIRLFLRGSRKSIAKMTADLMALIKTVKDPFCRKLLLKLFGDSSFIEEFQQSPAAKTMHHAYLGGLLEHTLAVTQLADILADFYPGLDRDLLVTGALLHDIGKTRELEYGAHLIDYTDRGRLVGHLVLGTEMVQAAVNTIPDFPQDLATRLTHLILSHHGRYEFGSPALPMISEAFVLHFLDDLDAKMNFLDRLGEQMPEPGYRWTDFQRTLERFLFVKGRPKDETEGLGQDEKQIAEDSSRTDSRQQNLF